MQQASVQDEWGISIESSSSSEEDGFDPTGETLEKVLVKAFIAK
jgi:hypothetical protein